MNKHLFLLSILFFPTHLFSQDFNSINVKDKITGSPITGATISIHDKPIAQTDSMGNVHLSLKGNDVLSISAVGYEKQTVTITKENNRVFLILMSASLKSMEEITVVSSTRTNQNIEYAPIKIEVLDTEEMQEESTVKPSTVLGIIGDISGVQVQQLSASSGNSNLRIQGLDGRYTQILRDGLPLYEGFSGGFGVMSIPPLDLKQVELIKGSASTLFGGGAIGGLVNLISKRPSAKQEAILTVNQTTLKESNLNSFISKRNKKLGYTFYAGITNQSAVDVNKDGLSDLSRLNSFVIHPRMFFYPKENTTITLGYTKTKENRLGGDMIVIKKQSDSVHQYFEKNEMNRNSGELLAERNFNNKNKFLFKSSLSSFKRSINSNTSTFTGNQLDYFSEASLLVNRKKQNVVLGINFLGNEFKKLSGDSCYLNKLANKTIGVFAQYTYRWKEKSSFEIGLRNDYHFKYGDFVLPRFAVFHQINNHWGMRAGFGAGYKIPDALTPQIRDYPINKLLPISDAIKPEKSAGYNAEINYKKDFGSESSLFINHAFFLTQINNPLVATQQSNGLVAFYSADKSIITKGFDTYIKIKIEDWSLYAGYTYTIAERKYLLQQQFIPYTPKFRMAYMLTKEWEGKGRFCIESSYNGSQFREDYSKTPSYLFLASMAEYQIAKQCSVVLNVENLLDYRQTKSEKIYTGTISNPEFIPLWAPIDGRALNLCLKLHF